MKEQNLVFLIIFSSITFLVYAVSNLSISYEEANIFFHTKGILYFITHYSTALFGQNDYALRLPFVCLHVISFVLLYKISKNFLKHKIDRVFAVLLYALLPGVNSAAILVNPTELVIFFTLLFIYFYMQGSFKQAYFLLFLMLFIDNSFVILYFSLFFYALYKKDNFFIVYSLLLFTIAMYIYGFDTGGKPKGYFLDTFGVYAAIFSPFLFLYFVYALYRVLIKEEKNILWYISFVTLVLSLLLSLRQKIHVEDFAPFVVISIPLMVKVFFNSYRVRLPIHRRYHNIVFGIVFLVLSLNFLSVVANKPLYYFLQNPQKHFAYKYHIAKDLAQKLKQDGIYNIQANDFKMQLRLKFYGIYDGGVYELALDNRGKENIKHIDIDYFGKRVQRYYLYQ